MRLPRIRSLAPVAVLLLSLLFGAGNFDSALEWAHNRLLASTGDPDRDADAALGPRNPDAVVVLGYALNRDGSPSETLEHRVRAAVREWERECEAFGVGSGSTDLDRCPVPLVFSGGHPGGGLGKRGDRSEAAAMRDLALSETGKDVPPPSWLEEETSTSTWENAVESLRLLSRTGPKRPLSVSVATSPFHQRRSLGAFRCAASKSRGVSGFEFSAAPSARPPPKTAAERAERAFEAGREVAAIAWYWARGRLCQ